MLGHSAFTAMPLSLNSSAIPNTLIDTPYLAILHARERERGRERKREREGGREGEREGGWEREREGGTYSSRHGLHSLRCGANHIGTVFNGGLMLRMCGLLLFTK